MIVKSYFLSSLRSLVFATVMSSIILYSTGGMTQSLTIVNLPSSDIEDNPVCYDASSGKLGNCPASIGMQVQGRMAWVAADGTGDFLDPVTAMNQLASWCQSPSDVSPCLLNIAPGTYELEAELSMVDFVNINGAGMNATFLKRSEQNFGASSGVVIGARATMRNLGILAAGEATALTDPKIVGIYNEALGLRLEKILVFAFTQASASPDNEVFGLNTSNGSVAIKDSIISTFGAFKGRAINSDSSGVEVDNSVLDAAGATGSELSVFAFSTSNVEVIYSKLETDVQSNSSTFDMHFSRIKGNVIGNGTNLCFATVDLVNDLFLADACP